MSTQVVPESDGYTDTDRKREMEELRRQRDFSESLVETAQTIVLVLDPEGRIVKVNAYFEQLSGYRQVELEGQDWFSMLLPHRVQDTTRALFRKAVHGIQTKGNVTAIVTKDGRERLIEWCDKTLLDGEGRVAGLLSIGQDVTDRKKLEEELRMSRQYLHNVIDSAGDPIFVKDDCFRFVLVNAAFRSMLGMELDQILGRTLYESQPEEQIVHIKEADKTVLESGQEDQREEEVTGRNGMVRRIVTKKTRFVDEKGDRFLVGVIHDITEGHKADERNRSQTEQLSQLMAELALVHEAERAGFSRMLHDTMGQNLTGLGLQLHALLKDAPPADHDKSRERILDCLSMVNDMADTTRELGDIMRPSVLDDYGLEAALRTFCDLVGSRAGFTVRYRMAEPPGPRPARGVEIALFRVVQEALNNVARHAEATEVVISLDEDAGILWVEVADNGRGFDAGAPRAGGARTGMGIQIMRRRAEAVGASCRVESRPGHGTRVIVEVPR